MLELLIVMAILLVLVAIAAPIVNEMAAESRGEPTSGDGAAISLAIIAAVLFLGGGGLLVAKVSSARKKLHAEPDLEKKLD